MYAAHFGLRDQAFSITPDPGFIYMSPRHQEALAHLLYGMGEYGGFVQLTGEVGTGKTTLIRALVEQHLDAVDLALVLNPRLTVDEFLAAIADELRVDYPRPAPTLKQLTDALSRYLLEAHARGRRTVLVIDEAQNLSRDVLEQVRLLTNLETHKHKLLRIILVGQPELAELLKREDLRQLAQRITARYHLTPLSREETDTYIRHRLTVVGCRRPLFTQAAVAAVYSRSNGVPRLINIICDRALTGAYAAESDRVTAGVVRRAAKEALRGTRPPGGLRPLWLAAAVLGGAVLGASAVMAFRYPEGGMDALLGWWADPEPAAVPAATSADPPETVAQPPRVDPVVLTPMNAPPSAAPAPSTPVPAPAPATQAASEQPLPLNGPVLSTPQPAPPPEPEPDPLDLALATDPWARLAQHWSREATDEPSRVCEWALRQGLRCLDGIVDWNAIERFRLPVVMTLDLGDRYDDILVVRADGDKVWVDTGNGSRPVPQLLIDGLWTGDAVMLWQPPVESVLIGPASRGDEVLWLRRRLAQVTGAGAEAGDGVGTFDQALGQRIRAFQAQHGLTVDGLAGARTLIMLSQLSGEPVPPWIGSDEARP